MGQSKLILVVSQYKYHKMLYESELVHLGYGVVTADDGNSAKIELDRIKEGGIDLIIMGSRRLKGVEVLEGAIVNMGDKAPPVIIKSSSAHTKQEYSGKPLEPHIKAYVLKSGDTTPLIKAVQNTIGPP